MSKVSVPALLACHSAAGRVDRWRVPLLAAVLLLASLLRLSGLAVTGFWFDELASLSFSHGWGPRLMQTPPAWGVLPWEPPFLHLSAARPVREIAPALVSGEVNPPAYFVLLRWWETLFGDTERPVRALSVCLSVIAVALLYAVARQHTTAERALTASLLMAVAGPQIEYAQEARPYVLLLVEVLAAVWLTDSMLQGHPPRWRAPLLAGIMLAALLTQYLAIPVEVGLAAVAVLTPSPPALPKSRRAVLIALVAALLLFSLCWGSALHRQLAALSTAHRWLVDDHPGRRGRVLLHLLQVPARFLFEPDGSTASSLLLLMGGSLWLALPAALRLPQTRSWSLWLLFTVAAVAVDDWMSRTAQLPLVRFTLAASPAAYLLISTFARGRFAWVLPTAAILLATSNLGVAYSPPWKNTLKPAGRLIAKRMKKTDALVLVEPPGADLRQAVQEARQYTYFCQELPRVVAVLDENCDGQTLAELQPCQRLWVVWSLQNRSLQQVLPGFELGSAEPLPPLLELYGGTLRSPATAAAMHSTAATALKTPVGPR